MVKSSLASLFTLTATFSSYVLCFVSVIVALKFLVCEEVFIFISVSEAPLFSHIFRSARFSIGAVCFVSKHERPADHLILGPNLIDSGF